VQQPRRRAGVSDDLRQTPLGRGSGVWPTSAGFRIVQAKRLLEAVGELVAHRGLVGAAEVEHEIDPAVADELRCPLVSRSRTTTVTRSSLKLVRAFVGPRPAYSLGSRPTWLAIASPEGPVAVGSKVGPGIPSSVLASLLKAESRERRRRMKICRATRLYGQASLSAGRGTYVSRLRAVVAL